MIRSLRTSLALSFASALTLLVPEAALHAQERVTFLSEGIPVPARVTYSDIAADPIGKTFLAAWIDERGKLAVSPLNAGGDFVYPSGLILHDAPEAATVRLFAAGGQFLIFWEERSDLHLAVVTAAGEVVSNQLFAAAASLEEAAGSADGLFVILKKFNGRVWTILGEGGRPIVSEQPVDVTLPERVQVAAGDGGFVIAGVTQSDCDGCSRIVSATVTRGAGRFTDWTFSNALPGAGSLEAIVEAERGWAAIYRKDDAVFAMFISSERQFAETHAELTGGAGDYQLLSRHGDWLAVATTEESSIIWRLSEDLRTVLDSSARTTRTRVASPGERETLLELLTLPNRANYRVTPAPFFLSAHAPLRPFGQLPAAEQASQCVTGPERILCVYRADDFRATVFSRGGAVIHRDIPLTRRSEDVSVTAAGDRFAIASVNQGVVRLEQILPDGSVTSASFIHTPSAESRIGDLVFTGESFVIPTARRGGEVRAYVLSREGLLIGEHVLNPSSGSSEIVELRAAASTSHVLVAWTERPECNVGCPPLPAQLEFVRLSRGGVPVDISPQPLGPTRMTRLAALGARGDRFLVVTVTTDTPSDPHLELTMLGANRELVAKATLDIGDEQSLHFILADATSHLLISTVQSADSRRTFVATRIFDDLTAGPTVTLGDVPEAYIRTPTARPPVAVMNDRTLLILGSIMDETWPFRGTRVFTRMEGTGGGRRRPVAR